MWPSEVAATAEKLFREVVSALNDLAAVRIAGTAGGRVLPRSSERDFVRAALRARRAWRSYNRYVAKLAKRDLVPSEVHRLRKLVEVMND